MVTHNPKNPNILNIVKRFFPISDKSKEYIAKLSRHQASSKHKNAAYQCSTCVSNKEKKLVKKFNNLRCRTCNFFSERDHINLKTRKTLNPTQAWHANSKTWSTGQYVQYLCWQNKITIRLCENISHLFALSWIYDNIWNITHTHTHTHTHI